VKVCKDEIELFPLQALERIFAARGCFDIEAILTKNFTHSNRDVFFVVYD
jgi:hypothetical protein